MRRDLHISFRFAALLALYVVFAIDAHAQESTDKAKVWSSSEMKWQDDKALPGVQSVPLWGNPASGEHGMLRKFPAGYAPPMHKHPSVERVVVITQKSLQIPIMRCSAVASLLAYFFSRRQARSRFYRALLAGISNKENKKSGE